MHGVRVGSELARLMLESGQQEIWCAVSDVSDEHSMENQMGNDFTACIVAFKEGRFYCDADMAWRYAVPIEIKALTQIEAGF